jgi:photosystem II stability/assembly factor-like uncharacterized protein
MLLTESDAVSILVLRFFQTIKKTTMNKFATVLLSFLLLFSISLNAQDFWQPLSIFGGAMGGADGKLYYTNGPSFYRSTNDGNTWDSLLTLPSGTTFTGGLITSSGTIFIATNNAGMIRSTDNGVTWTSINTGFTGGEARKPTMSSSGVLFIGSPSSGIFRSTNNGDSWTQINSGLTNLNTASIGIDSAGNIFTGVKGTNGMFKSTDNGDTWTLTSLTTSMRFYSLTVAPNGDIYAGSRYDPNAPNPNGLYRSTDNGETWSHFGLAGQSINTSGVVFAGGTIYTATDTNGVYRSTDGGASWDSVNTGLSSRYILTFSLHNGYLYAGTYGGLFRSVQNVNSVIEQTSGILPDSYLLMQNYPNPFNPTTNIEFQIPPSEGGYRGIFVTFKVFDVLGKEVATLVNQELHPGTYSVSWDASNTPSGIYYYQLQSGNYVETRRMTLVR